jgi:hypothetical protein
MTGLSSYPTYPPGPGRSHVRERDRTGTVTSAVIGLGCLLATIAVIVLTSDDLPSNGTALGASRERPTSSGPVVDASPIPVSELERSFPLPPGAGPSHLDPGGLVDGTRAYDVRAPLNVVKKYYDQRLARLGYIYMQPSPTRTRAGGRIIGWAGSVAANRGDYPEPVAFMTLNDDYFGGGPGVVTIEVRFT